MTLHVCKTEEEIKEALLHANDTVTSEELDEAEKIYGEIYQNPICTTLSNYLDAIYLIIDEECGDWGAYIDFVRYFNDLIQDSDNLFTLIQTNHGYCVVCEDVPDNDSIAELADNDIIEV